MINLIDGNEYQITFNNGQDTVQAIYIDEYKLFSHCMGSVSLDDAEKIERIKGQ